MRLLHELRTERSTSESPVIKIIEKGTDFNVIGIALDTDVKLKDHKTSKSSKLMILEGTVEYKEGNRSLILNQYDEIDIHLNITHSLEAKEAALCMLIQKK